MVWFLNRQQAFLFWINVKILLVLAGLAVVHIICFKKLYLSFLLLYFGSFCGIVFLYLSIGKEKVTVLSLAFEEVENRRHSLELDKQQKPTQNFQFFSCLLVFQFPAFIKLIKCFLIKFTVVSRNVQIFEKAPRLLIIL